MKKRKEAPSSLGPDSSTRRTIPIRWRKDGALIVRPSGPGGAQFNDLLTSRARPTSGKAVHMSAKGRVAKLANLVTPRRSQGTPNWNWKPQREQQSRADAKAVAARVEERMRRRAAEKGYYLHQEAGATERQLLAYRLTQIEGLTQRAAGERMGISHKNVAKLLKKLTP
jgi:hypothetical protein